MEGESSGGNVASDKTDFAAAENNRSLHYGGQKKPACGRDDNPREGKNDHLKGCLAERLVVP